MTATDRTSGLWRRLLAFALFAFVLLTALAIASSSKAAVESPPPPQVWSDKADYAPGEQVTLAGANWAPGEAVHIRVNDNAGQTWSRDADVTAAEDGTFTDQFNLPDLFVANYSVTATGASSGTATWSFTDSNVGNISGASPVSEGSSGTYSAQISGCNQANPCGYTWSITAGNATISSGATGSVNSTTTVSATVNFSDGPSGVNVRITATGGTNGNTSTSNMAVTVNNVAPTVTITGNASPNEGATEQYDYTVSDPGADAFTVGTPSCGTGTLVQNMPAQQRFRCKFLNGPASTSVSITATDDDTPGLTGTGNLGISVQNVNPTVNAPSNQSATQGQSASLALGSFTDPGAEASWSVTVNWGDGSTNDTFSVTGNTGNAVCASPCTLGPRSHTYATTGSKTVTVTVNDGTGSAQAQFTVTVSPADAIAPTTTATPTPAANGAGWNNTNVSVSLSATDNAGGSGVKEITYSAGGAQTIASTTVSGASAGPISITSEGTTTLSFFAKDNAGNTESTKTLVVRIDKTAPDTSIAANPSNPSDSSSASFSFGGSDPGGSGVAGFECKLDGAAFSSCTSPQSYSSLAEGSHTFQVRATDAAGNTDASPASFTWVVDTTPPTLAASAVKGTAPDFTDADPYVEDSWTNQDVRVDFSCSDPGGSGVAAGDPDPSSVAYDTEGEFTASSDCFDNAGNSVSKNFGVKIDKTPPTITATITPAPNAYGFNNTDVTVSYDCDDALSGLNTGYGDGVTGCPSDELVSAEGLTTIHRGIFDNAGNGTQSDVTVRIDKTKPSSSASSPAFNNTPTIHVTYSASDNVGGSGLDSVELWVRGPSDATYTKVATDTSPGATGSFDYVVPTDGGGDLVDGTYRFYTIAVDKASNRENTPSTPDGATTQTVQDSVAPNTSIDSNPSNPSNSSSASFSFSHTDATPSSGLKRFECKLDSAPSWVTCTSPQSYSSLAEGSHTFQVRAVDNAENTDASPASFSWFVDTVRPDTVLDSHPADPTASTSASFSFHATDASPSSGIAGFECKLDGGSYSACTSPQSYSGLGDGSHTFSVRASDNAGNTDASPASFTWLVDTVAPVTTDDAPSDWKNTAVTVHLSATDGGSGVDKTYYRVDSNPTYAVGTSVVISAPLDHSNDGTHTIDYYSTDNAGNTEADKTATVKIDTANPTITFASRAPVANGNGWNKTDVTVKWDCADSLSGVVAAQVSDTKTAQAAGQTAHGTCEDNAGNTASDSLGGISIDKTAPSLSPSIAPAPPLLLGASATASANASDGLSGVDTQSCGAVNTSTVGTHSVSCNATDKAGNSASASLSYAVYYNWKGFFQPIDNNPDQSGNLAYATVWNSAKAGQAIPVKFSLTGNQGLSIFFDSTYPKATKVTCPSAATSADPIETYAASNSGLQYDATADQYVYVWKTTSALASTCQRLEVKLVDGTSHYAWFKLTR